MINLRSQILSHLLEYFLTVELLGLGGVLPLAIRRSILLLLARFWMAGRGQMGRDLSQFVLGLSLNYLLLVDLEAGELLVFADIRQPDVRS